MGARRLVWTTLGIIIGTPALMLGYGAYGVHAEAHATRHCRAAMTEADARLPEVCNSWLGMCRSAGACNFEAYWPARVERWVAAKREHAACLELARTDWEREICPFEPDGPGI